ncbi:histidine kinase [Methylobacterium sp. E-045]|uniref:HAMP domain-containing sensor histidine kinase n=1 Tax=Methylobacterium sp. E-045 TaxID=2836575 RepID=UPI001FBB6BB1|nr:histidine kinase [Methylobacterium sp. E-045]MCJ2128010.1 histidine kinase [Methylobacterium sp. E-045]
MSLLIGLILRIMAVVLLCLACATAWVIAEVHEGIRAETAASADRVVREAQELAWRELTWRGSTGRLAKYAFPDWRSSHTLRFINPGNCVALTWEGEATLQQCSGLETAGGPAPAWFEWLYRVAFGEIEPIRRVVTLNRKEAGVVLTTPDRGAAVRQVWRQVRVLMAAAAAMAGGIALLAIFVIGIALRPAQIITRSLSRMEEGNHSTRLPRFRAGEFDRIARAVNALSERLRQTTAERTALTQRLFAVQEEERRALARDLHDEFGQCLTATGALASAIEAEAGDRPELREDARSISRITRHMMGTLKGALARLRPPDLDEFGLEHGLRRLVSTWERRNAAPAAFSLSFAGDLSTLSGPTALSIYRIVQECLTNAVRHGRPTQVDVSVVRMPEMVMLGVVDDGGGDAVLVETGSGQGVLGIRERIAALGGTLTIAPADGGVRIEATIPCPNEATQPTVRTEWTTLPDLKFKGIAA